MKVWRLCRRPFARLDGEGARLYGGRWNSPGQPVIYTSINLSLAILEVLVHLEVDYVDLPDDYVSVSLDIPDDLELSRINIPAGLFPHLEDTRDIGDSWLHQRESVGLYIPSLICPDESNLLLNPGHPDFRRIQQSAITPFQFDQRLFNR